MTIQPPVPLVEREKPHVRIVPAQGWAPISIAELWNHRDLLYYLILRDVRSNTRATRLGVLWIVLQPLAMAAIVSVVLGFLVKVPTGGVAYPVLVLSGLVVWNYFSATVSRASLSMISSGYLLQKIYFPRLIIPIVPAVAGLIDMAIMLAVLFACCIYYDVFPTMSWVWFPLPLMLMVSMSFGLGLWAAALTVRLRDVGNLIPVILQLGAYVSPVFYPSFLVPEQWRWLYELNPLVAVINVTRDLLFASDVSRLSSLAYPAWTAALLLISGVFYFRISEDIAADVV